MILMLLIGGIYSIQNALWLHELQWDYKNAIYPSFFGTPDAYHYITQIKEIYEGNYSLANSYLAEYKEINQSVWPRLPLFLATWFGKLLHLRVPELVVFMDFLLPPLSFLFAYGLLYTLTLRRKIALLGALFLALTPHLFWLEHAIPTGLRIFLIGPPILTDMHCYHCFSRPINPQLTYPFLLAALFFFVKYLKTSKIYGGIFCIIFGGIVSYSYVYFSTYLYTCLGLVTLGCVLLKAYSYVRKALMMFVITVLIALPFWFSVFSFSDAELNQVSWVYKNHTPILDLQFVLTVPLCIFIFIKLLKKTFDILPGITSLSLLLSGVICLNQHVVTGMNTQPEWHYNMFVRPQAAILAVSILLSQLMNNLQKREGIKLQRFLNVPLEIILLLGGLSFSLMSVLFRPAFVVRYFSPDGSLSPKFIVLLHILFWGTLLLGGEEFFWLC